MTSFLILHGFGGSTDGHWQEWLSKKLDENGFKVYFPQFPDWNRPQKSVWLSALNGTMEAISNDEKLIVIAHSLGCVLWLHYAAQKTRRKVSRAVLVSPPASSPGPEMLNVFFPEASERKMEAEEAVQSFYPFPDNKKTLSSAADQTVIITSTTDPFLPGDSVFDYRAYGVPILLLPNKGHINVSSGFGPWPWILNACLQGALPFPEHIH
ncbi:RBBP9/YdeN family alpha/beta hydrolase [Sporolactobacillus pectinivorans]|uniref:RBBP9/YdeN family alpha/beta hydrolase n=1 Tax=Sporolactobacillus pectinivorans TaxID=1591408 RepID=UPI000C264FA6|nr:alpha/beta fold hydrolase [Sporolactobacillus pectinivorans]